MNWSNSSGRSLGHAVQYKKRHAAVAPEALGRAAYAAGQPITACPRVSCACCGGPWGHGNAWRRGWHRARMEDQKRKK